MPLPFLPGLPLTLKTFLEIFAVHSYTLIVKEVFFMNVRRKAALISLFFSIAFLMPCQGWAQLFKPPEPPPGSHAPIITHAFAVEKGYYGYIWKIYIEAEDPDGDMFKITSELQQEGVRYRDSVDTIYVKKRDQKYLKGYLALDTFFLREPGLSVSPRLALRVSITDKAGNESKSAVFHFEFTGRRSESTSLPPPFDQGDIPKLGNIMIEGKHPPPRSD